MSDIGELGGGSGKIEILNVEVEIFSVEILNPKNLPKRKDGLVTIDADLEFPDWEGLTGTARGRRRKPIGTFQRGWMTSRSMSRYVADIGWGGGGQSPFRTPFRSMRGILPRGRAPRSRRCSREPSSRILSVPSLPCALGARTWRTWKGLGECLTGIA